ncbi:MAG: PSD1 and planctomycete cytochrome C domain-containing protein [Bryobacteraceae bacterium]
MNLRIATLLAAASCGAWAQDFAKDVQPIFERRCQGCHGATQQMGNLRLDSQASIARVVDGKLYERVSSTKKGFMMPAAGAPLTAEEIAKIKAWIDAGAKFPAVVARSTHWAFLPIQRPAGTSIDAMVRERLARENIAPSPEADRRTLIRRVSLDLTGLPPTPREVEEFVADTRPDAYEKLVDRLLASAHYGEKWARAWLDVAHYADSDGYEKDLSRPWAWRYRQWVIDALNRDEPFDQFTMQQIAGDLLPDATTDDRVATGFLRNTLTNREGGVDRKEARFEQIVNRTNTVSITWLGLTTGCAQCHNHKFDPISQKEYYSLYAFFDHAEEVDMDAPMPGEKAPPASYYQTRSEILEQYWIAELQPPWERRLREAYTHPGENGEWDFTVTDFTSSIDRPHELLTDVPEKRLPRDRDRMTLWFLQHIGVDYSKDRSTAGLLREARSKLEALVNALPPYSQAQVMHADPSVPPTHLRVGGDYRTFGVEVSPGTPAILPPLPAADPTRLDLARWLVSKENPLTARVTVNRIWQEFFGRGIVFTSEDFGTQGDRPSNPELLDFLASEFRDNGWSMKRLEKLIVMSATYRQSSKARPELETKDPENTLLARQSRVRLPAELIRDQALAASGLLNPEIGGRSVRPPQPKGVAELGYADSVKWRESTGSDKYRRGLYIHYQRTTPYPQLSNFDEPDSNVSCTRRRRSNTPLQALNLLNDPVFYEAAQALAVRIQREGGADPLGYAFELCVARMPTGTERARIAQYRAQGGDWVGVSRILLNLDELITRE